MDLGAHGMYLAQWLLGMPDTYGSAMGYCYPTQVEDNAVTVMGYNNGAVAVNETSFVSNCCPVTMELGGENGFVYYKGKGPVIKSTVATDYKPVEEPLENGLPRPIIQFLTGNILGGCGIDDGIKLAEMMDGAYRQQILSVSADADEYWDLYDKDRNLLGRRIKAGTDPQNGEFRLVAHAWIRRSDGKWLITQRTPGQPYDGWWEPVSGSVCSGENTLDAAIREVKEEIGITVRKSEVRLFEEVFRPRLKSPNFCDMWIFDKDVSLSDITFQPEECCNALWLTKNETYYKLMDEGIFMVHDMEAPIKRLLETN